LPVLSAVKEREPADLDGHTEQFVIFGGRQSNLGHRCASVWRSPQLSGEFSRDRPHTVDVDGDGQYELSFGTNVGAVVPR
jgi:hypothetical protein